MSYELNEKAHYAPNGNHKEVITRRDLSELNIIVQDDNKNSSGFHIKLEGSLFSASVYRYINHGDFYQTSAGFQSAKSAYNMQHDPLKLWDTQLNFAIHCATSALGVSVEHLNTKEPLVRALYRFHVYYHVRRILKRILAPLPNEENFNKYNNNCSKEQAFIIADEYGTSKNFYVYRGHYYYWKDSHASPFKWIMPDSNGFTKAGIEKISESIRAYTYLILTSQYGARHGILGNGAEAIVAQRLFHDNLEDVINKTVSLQDDVSRYQDSLKYARSKLDYSVGKNLYMLPSNMLLRPLNQVVEGYNDKIVINSSGHNLGKIVPVILKKSPQISAKNTRHVQLTPKMTTMRKRVRTLDDHNDEKTAIIGVGLAAIYIIWRYL